MVASRDLDLGCHAEYVTVAEQGAIATIPDTISEPDAVALCFGGSTALHFLEQANLTVGQKVLINGASGAVGAMAVQLAKHTGAEVTAVCSGANADLVTGTGSGPCRRLHGRGLHPERPALRRDHGQPGQRHLRRGSRRSLEPGGRVLMVYGDLWPTIAASWQKAVISGTATITANHLQTLLALTERGALRPVIDSVWPFDQIVHAHRRVDGGHKVGESSW